MVSRSAGLDFEHFICSVYYLAYSFDDKKVLLSSVSSKVFLSWIFRFNSMDFPFFGNSFLRVAPICSDSALVCFSNCKEKKSDQ